MTVLKSVFSEKQREAMARESPTPMYFQLYQLLKTGIQDGTFPDGSRLPTEKELSEEFGISRITAKRSLDELAAEGLVERRRGKGTHVTYRYRPKPVHAPLTGMLQEIESMALSSHATVIDCDRLQPPQAIRDEFGLEPGETLLYLARTRERDGLRFGYYKSWTRGVRKPRNPNLFEKTPRLRYFRDHGLEISHVTQTIRAVGAERDAAKALGVPEGSPLLSLRRRSYDRSGDEERMVDYLEVFYHPDRFQYRMDLTLDG
ncbi:MAG: GntR family transcriptional regulator [Gammaproteobacteria bacterium]